MGGELAELPFEFYFPRTRVGFVTDEATEEACSVQALIREVCSVYGA